jgi:hypothetical protein
MGHGLICLRTPVQNTWIQEPRGADTGTENLALTVCMGPSIIGFLKVAAYGRPSVRNQASAICGLRTFKTDFEWTTEEVVNCHDGPLIREVKERRQVVGPVGMDGNDEHARKPRGSGSRSGSGNRSGRGSRFRGWAPFKSRFLFQFCSGSRFWAPLCRMWEGATSRMSQRLRTRAAVPMKTESEARLEEVQGR